MKKNYWRDKFENWAGLDVLDRMGEIVFGLIMVLTITGAVSVAGKSQIDLKDLAIAALGGNLAWGLVDGVMYLLNSFLSRARERSLLHQIKQDDDSDAQNLVRENLPAFMEGAGDAGSLAPLVDRIRKLPDLPKDSLLVPKDYAVALQIFLLVVCSALPMILPLCFLSNTELALRLSNLIAILSLFLVGYSMGNYAGIKAWRSGLIFTTLGLVLVAIIIALGG